MISPNPNGAYVTVHTIRMPDGAVPTGTRVDVTGEDLERMLADGAISKAPEAPPAPPPASAPPPPPSVPAPPPSEGGLGARAKHTRTKY